MPSFTTPSATSSFKSHVAFTGGTSTASHGASGCAKCPRSTTWTTTDAPAAGLERTGRCRWGGRVVWSCAMPQVMLLLSYFLVFSNEKVGTALRHSKGTPMHTICSGTPNLQRLCRDFWLGVAWRGWASIMKSSRPSKVGQVQC
eukprot:Skav220767  [mRNA]  locus=scaffold3169:54451:54882:+ [translate_table: standard]